MERKRSDQKKKTTQRKPSGAALMQPAVTQAIESALFEEWARTGYAALSMEAVARRAGVGKAAIYRRFGSKLELATESLTRLGRELVVCPDTGTLEGDVFVLLRQLRRMLRHRLIARILPDLHAEMPRTPELAKAIRSNLQVYRRARARDVLIRAVERGELSDALDLDLATDMIGSMIYWRMIITREKAGSAYLTALSIFVAKALRANSL